uniref:Retrovirus-related Pol polyprotein from transposon 297 family n=1 Tax=Cajanus cajan TaxID=3821 RepID=A0A151T4B2_CAJCA|nr:Retrovirus-related Pol polyprotein from transposon 297 family [Cajanus cajan]
MNEVFKGLLSRFVLVFFDDILVYSCNWKDHLYHLEIVLRILKQHQLYAKLSKCAFGVKEVEYLGHTLSGDGVAMDNSKLAAVKNWVQPKNIKQSRGFMGLTGYYRRFVKNYAMLAAPLIDLLKKDAFKWTEEDTLAFDKLKEAMISAPVLALPNFKEIFILETDASGTGIGSVLSQGLHPIAYFSKKLSLRMQK